MFFHDKPIKVLSIDGGGIRGLIPLYILKEIEQRLRALKNNKPLVQIFDLMAGTSAGGLITLALNAPRKEGYISGRLSRAPQFTIDDIIAFFEKHGITIFPHGIFEQLREIAHFFRDKYSAKPLENLMYSLFGERTLKQAISNVIVTAYDIEKKQPYFFRKRAFTNAGFAEKDFYMRDIVRAATAAPTFFEPAIIQATSRGKDTYCLIDGAVFAQNPSLAAYTEARSVFRKKKKVLIVSLGTGNWPLTLTRNTIRHWGYYDWISPAHGVPLPNIMVDGQAKSVDSYLSAIPDVDYFRIDGNTENCSEDFTDAREKNIECIHEETKKLIQEKTNVIDKIVDRLRK